MAIRSLQKTAQPLQKTSQEMTVSDYAVPIRMAHRRALLRYNENR